MKYALIILSFISFFSYAQAARFSSTIYSVDFSKTEETHLVRFDNGRVSFIPRDDQELLESLVVSHEKKETVEVQVDGKNNVIAAQTVDGPDDISELDEDEGWSKTAEDYRPAVLNSTNTAIGMFNKMRRGWVSSGECYNRAHIWAYEEYKRSRRNGMKIFMFFTERYIRNYRFHWWFHVTPMYYVQNLSSPRTLDKRYTSGPRQTKIWSNVFVRSQRTCKRVTKFDDYWENQESQDCYHIYASMYYVIPRDLEKRDLTGTEKTEFVDREIRRAYSNGFNIRRDP